jgi:hypothetical protein
VARYRGDTTSHPARPLTYQSAIRGLGYASAMHRLRRPWLQPSPFPCLLLPLSTDSATYCAARWSFQCCISCQQAHRFRSSDSQCLKPVACESRSATPHTPLARPPALQVDSPAQVATGNGGGALGSGGGASVSSQPLRSPPTSPPQPLFPSAQLSSAQHFQYDPLDR